jgi:hypothetical protein
MSNQLTNEALVKTLAQLTTNIEQILAAPYGQQGAHLMYQIAHTVTGDFYCIVALADDVQLDNERTDVNWTLDGNQATSGFHLNPGSFNIVLPVGMPIYGDFKSIGLKAVDGALDEELSAIKLIAYRK